MEKMFTIRDTAVLLGMQVRTARQWVRDGKIKGVKFAGSNRWKVSETEIKRVQNNSNSEVASGTHSSSF